MKNILKISKEIGAAFMLFALAVTSIGFAGINPSRVDAVPTNWSVSGTHVVTFTFGSSTYPHNVTLSQSETGDITGSGSHAPYAWTITSGNVSGNTVTFTAIYTATPDAVDPLTTMTVNGTIQEDGSVSGTWSDNYQAGSREGTFTAPAGTATVIPVVVVAKVITNPATSVTNTGATLNGKNGGNAASGHSFWASLNTFSTEDPILEEGVFTTPDLGPIAADTDFSAPLASTSITITPNTQYYFSAWSLVDGTWYPGQIMTLTTASTTLVTGTTTSTSTGDLDGEVVSGNGVLEVTSITKTKGTAIANGVFEDGWVYTFNITVPTNEKKLAMKLGDWVDTANASNTIATANNVRISSAQADNSGAKILLTEANTYSAPELTMATDLNTELAGMQVQVIVEVKVPTGSANGSYSTSYGVKTSPVAILD
jgi:hypothetical protein